MDDNNIVKEPVVDQEPELVQEPVYVNDPSAMNNGFSTANTNPVQGPNSLARGMGRFHNPMQMPKNNENPKSNKESKTDSLGEKNGLDDKGSSLENAKDNNKKGNPLPGASKGKNEKPNASENKTPKKPNLKQNDNNKGKLGKKMPAPKTGFGKAAAALSKLRSKSKDKKESAEGESEEKQDGVKNLTSILPIGNPVVRLVLLIAGPALPIIFLIIAIVIIVGLIPTFFESSTCDKPSYSVNSSDATEFLCNMQSPFKEDEYTVTGVSGWRFHPIDGDIKFHAGTDVVGSGGGSQQIYAVADGKVEQAGWYGGYGNSVLIDHNGNFKTRYAHLSSISVAEGSKVNVGDQLGVQGSTGSSTATHLHFEILDSSGKYLSANPFFGYSDQGYEECVNPDKSVNSSSPCVKSDTPSARKISKDEFAQICGRTNAYSPNSATNNACCGTATNNTSASLIDFIGVFEGGVGKDYQCKTKDGQDGYLVYNHGDKNTVGPGVTTDYLPGITVNQCVAKTKVEEGMNKAISSKRSTIQSTFSKANLNKHQEDAMTSMAYNGCGTFFKNIAKAAEKDNFSEVWSAMKGCTNSGTLGLQRRRKAEFALYVTGDYSVAEAYKSKTWSSAEYDNYDSDGVMAKKMSGTSANYCGPSDGSSSGNKVIDIAARELKAWNGYNSEDQYCAAVKKYMNACGHGSEVHEYCAGFVTYVLKEAGIFDSLGLPSNTCVVKSLSDSSKVKVHDAGGSYTPKPGDLFVKVGSSGKDWGHIGFVEKVEGTTIHTIEGNTDPFEGFCRQGKSDGADGLVGSGTIRRKNHKEAKDDITHYISY